jgi:hypothetical protein
VLPKGDHKRKSGLHWQLILIISSSNLKVGEARLFVLTRVTLRSASRRTVQQSSIKNVPTSFIKLRLLSSLVFPIDIILSSWSVENI